YRLVLRSSVSVPSARPSYSLPSLTLATASVFYTLSLHDALPILSKRPSLYSLRHTHASLMLDAGMEVWKLSRHMGHASQAVTENVYAHLMPDAHYQAASFAAKALEGRPEIGV